MSKKSKAAPIKDTTGPREVYRLPGVGDLTSAGKKHAARITAQYAPFILAGQMTREELAEKIREELAAQNAAQRWVRAK